VQLACSQRSCEASRRRWASGEEPGPRATQVYWDVHRGATRPAVTKPMVRRRRRSSWGWGAADGRARLPQAGRARRGGEERERRDSGMKSFEEPQDDGKKGRRSLSPTRRIRGRASRDCARRAIGRDLAILAPSPRPSPTRERGKDLFTCLHPRSFAASFLLFFFSLVPVPYPCLLSSPYSLLTSSPTISSVYPAE